MHGVPNKPPPKTDSYKSHELIFTSNSSNFAVFSVSVCTTYAINLSRTRKIVESVRDEKSKIMPWMRAQQWFGCSKADGQMKKRTNDEHFGKRQRPTDSRQAISKQLRTRNCNIGHA